MRLRVRIGLGLVGEGFKGPYGPQSSKIFALIEVLWEGLECVSRW